MAAPTLKYAALATLNLWLMTDASVHADLNNGSNEKKLAALARGAHRWGFDSELLGCHEEGTGLARFQPALAFLDGLELPDFEGDVTTIITKTAHRLSLRYGNRNLVSATTKLLWMKFKSPIIVYDADTELALGTDLLRRFYDQWHARFAVYESEVLDACESLQHVLNYVCDPEISSAEFVQNLAAESWFQQRVFGSYLANIGRNAR